MPAPYSDPSAYILVTDAAGHLRRFLPRKHFQAFTAQKTADNGFDTFQLDLSAEVTDLDNIQFRDQVELWFGCVLQYRGFVQEKHRALPTSENDPPTLTLAGNGVSFEAGIQDVDGDLQLPLNTDIAEAWRRAFERTVFPSLPGLVAQAVPVGVTLQKQEGTYKLFKDVAQSLVSGVADGMAVTGGDADAEGNNRLFLRPYSDKQDWALVVPGGKGTAAEARDNSRDVRNRIRLFGGATRWPNLFPNPTFARLVFSDLGHANLLADHSFEAAPSGGIGSLSAAWTGGGSPAVMAASSGLGGAVRVGTQALTLNTVGQSASQTVSVTGGDTYTFTVHARREALDVAGAAQVSVDWGSRTDTVDVTPADLGFSYWGATVAAPAGASSATLTVTCTSGSGAGTGVVVDDLMLADVSGATADGWVLNTFGTAKIVSQNWLYDLDAYRGSHCLHVQVTATDADNEDAHLEMGTGAPPSAYHAYAERRLPITAGEALRLYVAVKSPPGVTSNGKMLLEIHYYTAGGYNTGVRTKVVVPAGAGFPEWTLLTAEATGPTTGNGLIGILSLAHGGAAPAGGAYAGAFLTFREDTDLLIGGMCLRDASAPDDEFVGEGAYVPLLDCTDPGLKDTDHGGAMPVGQGITDAAAASPDTYGVRCEPLSDQSITNRADARALAAAFFNANAVAYPQPSVTVVNDARPFFPGEGVTLVGEAGKALMAGAPAGTDGRPYLPIAQVRLQVDDTGNFLQTLDLQEAKLDAYRRIYKASRKAAQAGGSAQVYTGVGAGGAASGGVSGGLAPPLIVTDGTTPIEGVAVLKLTGGVLSSPEDGEADFAASLTVENDTDVFTGIQTLKLLAGTLTNPAPGEADYTPDGLGDVVLTGPYASRPAPAERGRLYLATDAPTLGRDQGVDYWEDWGPVLPLFVKSLIGFTASDASQVVSCTQAGGSLTFGAVTLRCNAGLAGGEHATLFYHSTGGSSETVTAAFQPGVSCLDGFSYGLMFGELNPSGLGFFAPGKVISHGLEYVAASGGWQFECRKWDTPSSAPGTGYTPAFADAGSFYRNGLVWLQLTYDSGAGTFTASVSGDGLNWKTLVPATDVTAYLSNVGLFGFYLLPKLLAGPAVNQDELLSVLHYKNA